MQKKRGEERTEGLKKRFSFQGGIKNFSGPEGEIKKILKGGILCLRK
jgi:hypothetical protein